MFAFLAENKIKLGIIVLGIILVILGARMKNKKTGLVLLTLGSIFIGVGLFLFLANYKLNKESTQKKISTKRSQQSQKGKTVKAQKGRTSRSPKNRTGRTPGTSQRIVGSPGTKNIQTVGVMKVLPRQVKQIKPVVNPQDIIVYTFKKSDKVNRKDKSFVENVLDFLAGGSSSPR